MNKNIRINKKNIWKIWYIIIFLIGLILDVIAKIFDISLINSLYAIVSIIFLFLIVTLMLISIKVNLKENNKDLAVKIINFYLIFGYTVIGILGFSTLFEYLGEIL